MKKQIVWFFPFLLLGMMCFLANSCKKETNSDEVEKVNDNTPPLFNPTITYGTLTDQDGNTYKTVTIGTQTWMAENLKTTKFRNGEPIPTVQFADWDFLRSAAYCNYDQESANVTTYGRLYNWYAVNDSRLIAPLGWHVPSDSEWTTLINFLGGDNIAGGKLKETGTTHWKTSWYPNNLGATNESGFTALPGGERIIGLFGPGAFSNINRYGYWWSATEYNEWSAWSRYISNEDKGVYRDELGDYSMNKSEGYSVRCIKDN